MGKTTTAQGILLRGACAFLVLGAMLHAQTVKRLWVLSAAGEIIEYDPATFAVKDAVKIPPQVSRKSDALNISRKGQILIAPNLMSGDPAAMQDLNAKLWFWNGKAATALERGVVRDITPSGSDIVLRESVPRPALSADGERLFWFANESRTLQREDSNLSVTTTFRAWQTDLAGAGKQELTKFAFPQCRCETGVCTETCPEASLWWPDDSLNTFFIVTHWIPGQTESQYQASFLYQKSEGKWTAKKLPHPLQRILDAAEDGTTLIESIPDSGCCGWDNESNDQTVLTRGGKSVVIFDERARYKNPNYDVSFFTAEAKLSPQLGWVGMTVSATAKAGDEVRLADEGHADAEELGRIKQALTDVPAVEVVSAADPGKRAAFLPRATLVGWLNDKEVLIVEDHLLVAFNVASGGRKKSGIKVPDQAYVFLR